MASQEAAGWIAPAMAGKAGKPNLEVTKEAQAGTG